MIKKIVISATIVLYKDSIETLQKTINCFLETPLQKRLYLVDNSPTDTLKNLFNHPVITYIFIGKNNGFGRAHNLVIAQIKQLSTYHLILNPDVVFEPHVIPNLIRELEKNESVSMISPKVIYPDGKYQYTCRKHPTIIEMISRRLGINNTYVKKASYRDLDLTEPMFPDFIHGCFFVFKTYDFMLIDGFDERYFLYMEDADICRKIEKTKKKVLYQPTEVIEHLHRRSSAKKGKLFFYHLASAFKYFKKWGF